jgi:hypothetical protein
LHCRRIGMAALEVRDQALSRNLILVDGAKAD